MLQNMPKNTATHTLHTFTSSHKSEHTYMNIIIMKTHYILNFYQKTYPTYNNRWELVTGTCKGEHSQFSDQNSTESLGFLGKGNKRKKTHNFFLRLKHFKSDLKCCQLPQKTNASPKKLIRKRLKNAFALRFQFSFSFEFLCASSSSE